MKKGYYIITILVALAFALAAIFISMMPEVVPIHYNGAGEIDGMGSRYEYLFFPFFAALMGGFMMFMARTRKNPVEKKVLVITGIGTTVLFIVLNVIFSIAAIRYDPAGVMLPDVSRIMLVLMGLMIIVLSSLMSRAPINSAFGLRTPWSMKNDEVWRKSQRFGGISGVICGFCMLIGAIFVKDIAATVVMLALIIIWTVVCTYMSYRFSKE